MNEKLQSIEQRRLEIEKNYKKNMMIGVLTLIPAIVLGGLGVATELAILIVFGVIVLIVAVFFFGKASSEAAKYRKIIKRELIYALLAEEFEDVIYDPKSSIPVSRINATGTIKRPDRFYGEDYIKGSYKGVGFEVSDVDLKQRVEHRDKNGNVHVSYETYFKGRWYIYKFQKHFDQVLKVVEGRGSYVNRKNLIKFDTESIEFNKKFDIFATSQEFGFYLITSSMIEKLLELEKLHRGSILYCFMNNELHIGVNDRKNYLEFKLKTPINEETLGIFMSDIELIPAIINEFRLDSNKFK
ncbi:hypothetical protein BK011_03795 [Tenericutes bacterium MZ-XQ]|jgi:hypothetical protein|nr:hypothetical protein BK011_03795 [Tenericutes bacterium MZ-XQ]